jgi:hypothetical protein
MTKIADDFEAIAKQLSRKAPAATAEAIAALTREATADPLVALAEQIASAAQRHDAAFNCRAGERPARAI